MEAVSVKEQIKTIFRLIEDIKEERKTDNKKLNELEKVVSALAQKVDDLPEQISDKNRIQTLEIQTIIDAGLKKQKDEHDKHLIEEGKSFRKQTIGIVMGVLTAVLTAMTLILLKLK